MHVDNVESYNVKYIDLDNNKTPDLLFNFCLGKDARCDIFILKDKWIEKINFSSVGFILVEAQECGENESDNCIFFTELVKDGYYQTKYKYSKFYNDWVEYESFFINEKNDEKTNLINSNYILGIKGNKYELNKQ